MSLKSIEPLSALSTYQQGYKIFVDSHHNQYTMWIIFSSVYVTIQVSSCACAGLKSTSHDCLLIGLQRTVADDFSYICLDKGKRELVNVFEVSKHNAETSHV